MYLDGEDTSLRRVGRTAYPACRKGRVPYPPPMTKARIVEIAAARPNFMKVAPVHREAARSRRIEPILVHAGQHYDRLMSDVFFADLALGGPDIELGIGSGTHAQQTARVLTRLEPHLAAIRPSAVLVVGDVNSTLAAALCAVKLGFPVAHVEAGLRSGDRYMPEQINRVMTDAIADLLLAPSDDAVKNLLNEGHPKERIHMVGNVMIDSLDALLPSARSSAVLNELGIERGSYFVATLHRPSNVDRGDQLEELVDVFLAVTQVKPLIFVAHPRTLAALRANGAVQRLEGGGVRILEPMGYIEFLALEASSAAVLTDSGGIQEETTVLGIPCLTLREDTERPVTVTEGTNLVVGRDKEAILDALGRIASGAWGGPRRPRLWDGRTARRIVRILEESYGCP